MILRSPTRANFQGHLYDGEIAYADHELGRLIEWLKRNKLLRLELDSVFSAITANPWESTASTRRILCIQRHGPHTTHRQRLLERDSAGPRVEDQ